MTGDVAMSRTLRHDPDPSVTGDLRALLYEMHRDTERLLDMLNRHGQLWQPEPGRANPDVERLPLLAARIVAAAMDQPGAA